MVRRTLILIAALVVALVVMLLAFRMAANWREVEPRNLALPTEGRLINTRLGQVYVDERGPVDGMPVLLIHGSVGWAGFWSETSEALAANGYRAIAMDLAPMGFSDEDPEGDYGRIRQSERIVAVTESIGKRPVLLAHSFGAGPAMEALMRHPEQFQSAIIVDGAIGVGDQVKPLIWPLRSQWVREVAVSATVTNPLLLRRLLAMFLHKKERATAQYVEVLKRPLTQIGTTRRIAQWLPTLLTAPDGAMSINPASYADLKLPVAIIWGAEDTATPLHQGEWLKGAIEGSRLMVLPGLGHIPQIEDPNLFQKAMLEALEGF